MRKKLLITFMSLIMVVSMLPVYSTAADLDSSSGDEFAEISNQLKDKTQDPFDYESDAAKRKAIKLAESTYPESYDLTDVDTDDDGVGDTSYVTPVKFQNPFGTCWGFAAIAAAESSILGNEELRQVENYSINKEQRKGADTEGKDSKGDKILDLSEKHLTYFLNRAISDEEDPQYGEGMQADSGVTVSDMLNQGGVPFFATSLFASGIGPNLEDRYDDDDKIPDSLLRYRGKNGSIDKQVISGKIVNYCYDDEDDWSIPDEYRFKQSYELRESYMLPSPANVDEDTNKYEYNPAGTAAIKDMLMNKRAVQIGFCADTSMPGQESDGIYISKNWAHYTYNAEEQANHAVTIVGWDDNYSKENFVEGHEPEGDGAWLVKNSWGSEEETFPNKGPGWGLLQDPNKEYDPETNIHTGYFWLSYYDRTISMPEALSFDKSNVGSSYNLDEHDFMPVSEIMGASTKDECQMSNVFKAEDCEKLTDVSCETTIPGTKVKSEVYLLDSGFSKPVDGQLVATVEGEYEYGGFHKMELDTPVLIQKDQYYSIVQTQVTPDGENALNLPTAMGEVMSKLMYGSNTWVKGVINKKESFLNYKGKWYDMSDGKMQEEIIGEMAKMMEFDNFPIKGYAEPTDSNLTLKVSGAEESIDLNDESNLRAYFKGDAGDDGTDAPKITWKLAEGGDKYFDLTVDPDNEYRATVKAKDYGESLLYVTAEGVGTTIVKLSVTKKAIGSIEVLGTSIYNGKAKKPTVRVYDEDDKLIPKSNYTLTYKNNKKCGQGRAVIKIKAGNMKYEGNDYGLFSIYPKKALIKKLKVGKRKLTIKVKSQKASGITSYKIKYKMKGKKKWRTKTFKAAKEKKLILKSLRRGRRYQVKVQAIYKKSGSFLAGKFSKVKTSKKIK